MINKPAIDYANARIEELKLSHEINDVQEMQLFDLYVEVHDDPRARVKLDEFIKTLKPKG